MEQLTTVQRLSSGWERRRNCAENEELGGLELLKVKARLYFRAQVMNKGALPQRACCGAGRRS